MSDESRNIGLKYWLILLLIAVSVFIGWGAIDADNYSLTMGLVITLPLNIFLIGLSFIVKEREKSKTKLKSAIYAAGIAIGLLDAVLPIVLLGL